MTCTWQNWDQNLPLLGFLFSDTTDGALRKKREASREKGIRRQSKVERGSSTVINYLGCKFLLFCKVSTQPWRGIAPPAAGEKPNSQAHSRLSDGGSQRRRRESPRVGSKWLSAWAEGKGPWKGTEQGELGSCLEPPWEGTRLPLLFPAASSPTVGSGKGSPGEPHLPQHPCLARPCLLPPQLLLGATGMGTQLPHL